MSRELSPHEREHIAHMERVRAVHRRSAYERIGAKLFELQTMERAGATMHDDDLAELKHVRELYVVIRNELIEYGQLPADAA